LYPTKAEPMALLASTSYVVSLGTPARSASTSDSASAWLSASTTVLTASLTTSPEPSSPTWKTCRARRSSTGRARSSPAAGPPTMNVSWPFSTSAMLPETGPSTSVAPRPVTSGSTRRTVSGSTVLLSTTTVPSRRPAAMPSGPS
jgi:hypothetical protein